MFTRITRNIFLWALILTLVVGCSPQIGSLQAVPVAWGTVLYGIQRVAASAPGTTLFQSGSNYVFVWSTQGAVGFFGINSTTMTVMSADQIKGLLSSGGQLVNPIEGSALASWLATNGWTKVNPAEAMTFINALKTGAITGDITVPMFVPAGMIAPSVDKLLHPDGGQS